MRILWELALDIAQLHCVITVCAAASLLYRCLKRVDWQGMPGRGETHMGKVKSIEGAAYTKAKDSFSQQHCGVCSSATILHSGSTWRLRYAHRYVWREPVHALLCRYSYRVVYDWIRNCSTTFESRINGVEVKTPQLK